VNNRSQGQERREFQRLYINLGVYYKVLSPVPDSTESKVMSLDISPLGMSFVSNRNLPVFSELELKFALSGTKQSAAPNLTLPIEVRAKVFSCILLNSNEFRVGVLFSSIDSKTQERLIGYIRESSQRFP